MKKFLTAVGVLLVSVCVGAVLFGCTDAKKYKAEVEGYDIFKNSVTEALPQTAYHDIAVDHFNSELKEGTTVKKALILTVDGFRADSFQFIKDNGFGILRMNEEPEGGVFLAYAGGQKKSYRTDTAPGTVSLMTGTWADEVGVLRNTDKKGVAPKSLFTDAVEKGLSVRINAGWSTHITTTFVEEITATKASVSDDVATFDAVSASPDRKLQDKILESIGSYDVTIGLYSEPDGAGHSYGFDPGVAQYVSAVVNTNALIEEAIQEVKARPTYNTEDWLILISTDHGGQKDKNHYQASITERLIFIACNKLLNYSDYLKPGYEL